MPRAKRKARRRPRPGVPSPLTPARAAPVAAALQPGRRWGGGAGRAAQMGGALGGVAAGQLPVGMGGREWMGRPGPEETRGVPACGTLARQLIAGP